MRATACGRLVSARCRAALQAPEMLYLQKLFELTIGPAVEAPEFRVHSKLRTTFPEAELPAVLSKYCIALKGVVEIAHMHLQNHAFTPRSTLLYFMKRH